MLRRGQLTGVSTENRPGSLRPDKERADLTETRTLMGRFKCDRTDLTETGHQVGGWAFGVSGWNVGGS
jgi:hypothetical protein